MSATGPLDLSAIRAGLAAAAGAADDVRVYAVVPEQVAVGNSAAVVVQAGDPWIDYHRAFTSGLVETNWDLLIVAQSTDIETGQRTVDELIAAGAGMRRSVFDAVMADRTLGGAVADTLPTGAGSAGTVEIGGVRYASAVLSVRVWIGRS